MKKIFRPFKGICSNIMLVTFLLLSLVACKEDRADLTGLLSTVPSSAGSVVGIHLQSLLKDAGCKVSGNEVTPGKELTSILESMPSDGRTQVLKFFDGSTGIVPECAVIFFDSNRSFLTFSLYDVDKFVAYVEKEKDEKFSDQGSGVKVCGNIALKGAQAWICLSSYKKIDADAIASYATLSESQSFLANDMAKKIIEEDDDIVGWSQMKTLLSGTLDRGQQTIVNLLSGFLFEDATAVYFNIDFEEGEMEAKALILNDKGKAAKYLLPAEKVDLKTLESLGTTCDGMLALTITPKMIQKIEKIGSAIGGALFSDLSDQLKNVDGTVGAIMSQNEAVSGVITTKGDVSMELKDMITSSIAPITVDGKYLRFSKGDVSGSLQVTECAEMLKGSCLGFVADMQALSSTGDFKGNTPSFKCLSLKLSPEDGGLELQFDLKGDNPKENILIPMLRAATK